VPADENGTANTNGIRGSCPLFDVNVAKETYVFFGMYQKRCQARQQKKLKR
jgi:hypothetical protein